MTNAPLDLIDWDKPIETMSGFTARLISRKPEAALPTFPYKVMRDELHFHLVSNHDRYGRTPCGADTYRVVNIEET